MIFISDTKEKILKEALNLFGSKGYAATSMNDIASAIGIKKSSLYFHYRGKEEIFLKLFRKIVQEHQNELDKIMKGLKNKNTFEKLFHIFSGYLHYCENNPNIDFWNRIFYFPTEVFKEEIYSKTEFVENIIKSEIEKVFMEGMDNHEIKENDPCKLTISFYYMMLGFMLSLVDYKNKSIEKDIKNCLEVFFESIKI